MTRGCHRDNRAGAYPQPAEALLNERGGRTKLSLAVIGAGRWGRNLIRVTRSLPGATLAAVCDVDARRLAGVREDTGARVTTDPETVLSATDVSAVLIATPAESHAALAAAALSAGKHVFVEKPMALTVRDAERVERAATEARRVLMVGHILHYDAAYATLADLVRGGVIGRPVRAFAVRHAESARGGCGAWWALAPHDVSFLCGVLSGTPECSHAVRDEATDRTHARFGFPGGAEAILDVSGAAALPARRLVLVGEGGVALLDAATHESTLRVVEGPIAREIGRDLEAGARRSDLAAASLSVAARWAPERTWPLERKEPLRAEVEAFVRAVMDDAPFPATAADGVRVTRALAQVDVAAAPASGSSARRMADVETGTAVASPQALVAS